MRLHVIIISSIILAIAAACKPLVPFRSSLVGKTFGKQDDCYRPSAGSSLKISKKTFTYIPLTFLSPVFQGDETYIFNFDSIEPSITFFPRVADRDSTNTDENEKFCKMQNMKTKQILKPTGSTKKAFFKAVKKIVNGLSEIKEFECFEDIMQKPGPNFANVEVDGIITYLLGVGYRYNVCVGKDL